MLFVSPILDATRTVAMAGLSIAKMPFDLMTFAKPTVVEVKVGLIHVGENVAARCIQELRLSYLSAPVVPNMRLKLELTNKDFLERFPVSQNDMHLVTRKLRRNILLGVGSWLNCEKSQINDDRVTMIFTPKVSPLSLTA
jgi:hypothetical protein